MAYVGQNKISNENAWLILLKQVMEHITALTDIILCSDAYGVWRKASACVMYNAAFMDATSLDNFSGLYKLDICQSEGDVSSYIFTMRVYEPRRCLMYKKRK